MKIKIGVEYREANGVMTKLHRTAESFEIAEQNLGSLERMLAARIADEKEHGEPAAFCTNQDGNCEPDERCNCKA